MRKYFTEYGLNIYTSATRIVPIDYLEQIEDDRNYHIYMVLSTPKTFIKNGEIKQNKKGLDFEFLQILNGKQIITPIKNYSLDPNLDHERILYESKYPYDKVDFYINKKNLINYVGEGEKNHIQDINKVTASADVLKGYCDQFMGKSLKSEVLYIGKAYGRKKKRTAIDRLKSHDTLQKILSNYAATNLNKSIYLYLLEMTPVLYTSFDGRSKSYKKSMEENLVHMDQVMKTPLEYEQVINITEAALINFFKPVYNNHFVENFPCKTHTGYTQYYNLDFNCINIELDLELEGFPMIKLYTEHKSYISPFENIQYDLYVDKNRKNMYDIFIEK